MKIVFLDVECANCFNKTGKIYSIGYMVCNENFEVLSSQKDIALNPDAAFDWYVVKNILRYEKSYLRSQPKFPQIYDGLKRLVENGDTIVAGYAVGQDIDYILDECQRYGLPSLTMRFIDVKKLIEQQRNDVARTLETEYEAWLAEKPECAHRSDCDAYMTMRVLQAFCNAEDKSFDEIMRKYPAASGLTENFFAGFCGEYYYDRRDKDAVRFKPVTESQQNFIKRKGLNEFLFEKYLRTLSRNKKAAGIYAGKAVCVSGDYEKNHFREMLKIVKIIYGNGGRFIRRASDADFFIKEKLTDRPCSREARISAEDIVKVISLPDFLKGAGLTVSDFEGIDIPDLSSFCTPPPIVTFEDFLSGNRQIATKS